MKINYHKQPVSEEDALELLNAYRGIERLYGADKIESMARLTVANPAWKDKLGIVSCYQMLPALEMILRLYEKANAYDEQKTLLVESAELLLKAGGEIDRLRSGIQEAVKSLNELRPTDALLRLEAVLKEDEPQSKDEQPVGHFLEIG